MQTQSLAQTALEVSSLSYGCMRIAGTWNPSEVDQARRESAFGALAAAYDAGYTLFDHADIYAQGACESLHGDFLRQNPSLRQSTVIATKCGIRFGGDPHPHSPHRYDFSYHHIVSSCEKSLKRLGVETIELYQLHRPDWLMDPNEVAEAFALLHAQGKVRYFGVSNFLPCQLSALQASLPWPLVVNQVEIHLGRLDPFTDGTLHQCLEQGITPLAWSPLAGGWLGEGGRAPDSLPQAPALLKLMDQLAEEHRVTRTEIALAWLLEHPSRIIPIVGSTKPDRIRKAVRATEIRLGREDWTKLLVAARGKPLE
jgi:predicted oxidoreductase